MLRQLMVTALLIGPTALAAAFTANPAANVAPRPGDAMSADAPAESRAYLHSFNLPGHGVALEGYSPVSYFSGRAERGSALFAVEHDGVTYHLANAEQVSTFRTNPSKYVPAFGGWCAFGMAVSDKFPVDPTSFQIVGGRLFLFLRNAGIDARELWNDGREDELLRKADAHWRKVQG